MDLYPELDAMALAELVRKKEVSPLELAEQAIERLERVNPELNAVVQRLYDEARRAAVGELMDGPFRGVPTVIKDMGGFLANYPYAMGSNFLRSFVPDHDSTVVKRIKQTGIVIIAKVSCPEFGILGVTESDAFGATRNPWNPEHTPGGSSGGSAAVVAARVVPFAHGGDGGGSLRLPAAACGLFSIKATRGRVPLGPGAGEGWGGLIQPGMITRSVRDCATMLDAISGPELGGPYHAPVKEGLYADEVGRDIKGLRIAFSTKPLYGETSHPDCIKAVNEAARLCEDLGHRVEEVHPPFDRSEMTRAYFTQIAASVSSAITKAERWTGKKAAAKDFEPSTWFLKQVGDALSASDLQNARDLAHRVGYQVSQFLENYDLFLSSTAAFPPVRIGEMAIKPHEALGLGILRQLPLRSVLTKALFALGQNALSRTPNTQLFNQTGHPAMSVPLHISDSGLPIGVQFVAPFGREDRLIRFASHLEKARPWAHRLPPIL